MKQKRTLSRARSLFALAMLAFAISPPATAGASLGQPAAAPDEHAAPAREPHDFVFVYIRSGPVTDLSPEERGKAFQGHFSNMKRLAEAGELLIAGPFGEPLAAPDHRGLFVIDATSLDRGMAIAGTDPTTKAGVFVLEGHLFTTDRPIRELPRLEKEAEAERLADPGVPDEWVGRGFVLVTAPFTDERLAQLDGTEGVLVAGRLHGSGPDSDGDGEADDQVLAWLDATDVGAAMELLGADEGDPGPWVWHGWYGSPTLAHMAD